MVTASASPVTTGGLRQGSDWPHFPLILSSITLVLISYSTNIWVCSDFHFSWFKPDTFTPKWPLTLSKPFTTFDMQKICIGRVAGDFWHSQRELAGLNICQFSLNILWFLVVLWFLLDHLTSIHSVSLFFSHAFLWQNCTYWGIQICLWTNPFWMLRVYSTFSLVLIIYYLILPAKHSFMLVLPSPWGQEPCHIFLSFSPIPISIQNM